MPLEISTRLPTPTGWTTVGELTADSVLFDELGYPCRVKSLSAPYQVEGYSLGAGWGRSSNRVPPAAEILCGADQELYAYTWTRWFRFNTKGYAPATALGDGELRSVPNNWPVWTRNDVPRASKRGRPASAVAAVTSVAEIAQTGVRRYDVPSPGASVWNYTVPATFSLQLAKTRLPLDPYLVGVCINYLQPDGTMRLNLEFFAYYRARFAEAGLELVSLTEYAGKNKHKLLTCTVPGMMQILAEMGWEHQRIPAVYLRACQSDRLRLLSGLMDQFDLLIDNYQVGHTAYFAKGWELAGQVLELLRSLGWPATVRTRDAEILSIIVTWRPAESPFKHPKLAARWGRPATSRAGRDLERYVWKIFTCEPAGLQIVRDVSVHSPHGLFAVSKLMLPMKGDDR